MEIFIFLIGIIIGSFLNVCIYRIPKGGSIISPPSSCTKCGSYIKPYDLIPIISYIILKGKCRKCGTSISLRYPLIELLTGTLFLLIFKKYGINTVTVKYTVYVCAVIVIGMIDFDTMDVYTKLTIIGATSGIVFIIISALNKESFMTYIYGAAFGYGIIALIVLLTKGGMGLGDAEILMIVGLFLGFKSTILTLIIAVIFGGLVAALFLIIKKKKKKDMIPFGPFIAIASIVTIIYGDKIISWYLK